MPELTIHEEQVEPKAVAPELVTGLPNESDTAALVRLARRRLERLDIEFQQLQAKFQSVKDQHTATVAFLNSLGIDTTEIVTTPTGVVVEPKRTILPPKGPTTKRRPYITSSEKDRIRMAWIDTGGNHNTGWVKKLKEKLATMGMKDIPDHVFYTAAKSWLK